MTQPNQYRREDSYYSFITRQSKTTLNISPAPSGFSTQNTQVISFLLAADQAMKFVSIDGNVFDNSAVPAGGLTVLNALAAVASVSSAPAQRVYPAPYGPVIILGGGIALHAEDEEWWFWNDFSERGGSVGSMDFTLFADLNNTTGAAIDVALDLTVVVELYEKQKIGLTGQQRINRDAQGHFIE